MVQGKAIDECGRVEPEMGVFSWYAKVVGATYTVA